MNTAELEKLNRHLSRHIGLNFKRSRWSDLERGIRKAAPEFGFDDPHRCMNWLLEAPLNKKQIDILSSILTVGETYFFRQQESFDIMRDQILPAILASPGRKPGNLRIWSAACSSGEEAYSVAILLDRMAGQLKGWDITLLATDINIKALEKAETGVYTQWAFRNTPLWVQKNYFTQTGENAFEILPRIREKVMFEYLNLAEDNYPSLVNNTNAMDIVFCRNVLMYFASDRARDVVKRLHRSLVTKGWLIVAPTDAFHLTDTECFDRHPDYTSVYSKCPSGQHPKHLTPLPSTLQHPSPFSPSPAIHPSPSTRKNPGGDHIQTFDQQTFDQARDLFADGNYAGVIELLEPLTRQPGGKENGATAGIYQLLARTHANLGKLDHALNWSEQALKIDKLDTGNYYLKAVILLEQGKTAEAVQALRRCIYLEPGFILAHFTLGNLYYQQKNTAEAQRNFKNALELVSPMPPDTPVSMEEGLYAGRLKEIIESSLTMIEGMIEDLHRGAPDE